MEKLRRLSDDLKSSFDSQSSQTAFHKLPNETSDFCIDDNDGEDEDEENNRRYKDYPSSASNSSSLEMTAYHDHGGSGASDPRQVELTFDDEGVDTQNHIPLSGYCFNPRTERRRDQWIVSMLLLLQVMLIVLFDVLSINHKLLDFLLFIYVFAGVPFVWVWERLFRQPHFLFEEERTATICGECGQKIAPPLFDFFSLTIYILQIPLKPSRWSIYEAQRDKIYFRHHHPLRLPLIHLFVLLFLVRDEAIHRLKLYHFWWVVKSDDICLDLGHHHFFPVPQNYLPQLSRNSASGWQQKAHNS